MQNYKFEIIEACGVYTLDYNTIISPFDVRVNSLIILSRATVQPARST